MTSAVIPERKYHSGFKPLSYNSPKKHGVCRIQEIWTKILVEKEDMIKSFIGDWY